MGLSVLGPIDVALASDFLEKEDLLPDLVGDLSKDFLVSSVSTCTRLGDVLQDAGFSCARYLHYNFNLNWREKVMKKVFLIGERHFSSNVSVTG